MAAKVMRFNVAEKTMTFPTNATTDSFTRQQLESGGREFLDDVLNRDLGFMRGIPNTIQYWQERRKELFAMIRQLGRPHVFLTLSASELHWDRLLETLERLRVGPEGRSRVESQEEVLYKNRLPEDVMEEGLGRYWIMSTLVLMSAVVLGLCCSLLLFVMIFSEQSAKADCTTVDTLASFYSKRTRMHIITSQMRTTPSHLRNTSVTYPDQGQVVPTSRSGKNICTGPLCRFLAEWLRHSIDYTVDPCDDFYKYVCASFRGQTMFRHTSDLVTWMKSLSLDLLNSKALETVDPVEMMVRGSLDLGVEAVISITFHDKAFQDGKRLMQDFYPRHADASRVDAFLGRCNSVATTPNASSS
ncbi:hypothetical protein MRX96_054723 [Rhipicephalus microplus]